MSLLLLVACLGTYVTPVDTVGPYTLDLPDDLEPVDLGSSKRQTMFLARYRRPAPAPEQEVMVARPTRVPDSWSDGPPPPSVTSLRQARTPLRYEPTTWLGGDAVLGTMGTPDGKRMYVWSAVRNGFLHELQCSADPSDGDDAGCQAVAASMKVAAAPLDDAPLPATTRTERTAALKVPVPEGWVLVPTDPAVPEQQLQAAPPVPSHPRAPRSMGYLGVEFYPGVQLLGTWVTAVNESFAERGQTLIGQETFAGPLGEAFLSEYSDGLGATITLDMVTPAGMVHVDCADLQARHDELRVLCARVFQGIELSP